MYVNLSNKVALITGGAGVIGSATAELMAACGAHVYIHDINREAGKDAEARITAAGGKVRFIQGNLTSEDDMRNYINTALSDHGRIDILVNNAGKNIGFEGRKPVSDYEEEDWNSVIDTCLDGLFYCCKYVLPVMRHQQSGKIINIGSIAGFRAPLRLQSPYSASKAVIVNMTRTLAIENGRYNINVNCVVPGSIMTAAVKRNVYQNADKVRTMLAHVPLGRTGEAEDIGNAVLFLVSDEAKYITGCICNVDGGWASGFAYTQ